jgi:hypothetical protein
MQEHKLPLWHFTGSIPEIIIYILPQEGTMAFKDIDKLILGTNQVTIHLL